MKNIDIHRLKHLYYHEKKSLLDIANIFDCSAAHIQYQMEQHGMPRRDARRSKISLDITEIEKLYFKERLTLLEVGKRMGVSAPTIRARLMEAGYSLRNPSEAARLKKGSSRFTDADESEMERLYAEEKLSCQKIAERFNCSAVTVQEKLKKRGIRLRTYKEAQTLRREKRVASKEVTPNPSPVTRGVSVHREPLVTRNSKLETIPSRTYTPPKRLGKVFEPIPLLPPEEVTLKRILQFYNEDNLYIQDIAAICSLSTVDVYDILKDAGEF